MEAKHSFGIRYYTLDGQGNPVPEPGHLRWIEWLDRCEARSLKDDTLPDGVRVSTVFAGFDTSISHQTAPRLWETAILGGPHDGYCQRSASREDARAAHATALEIAKGHSPRTRH